MIHHPLMFDSSRQLALPGADGVYSSGDIISLKHSIAKLRELGLKDAEIEDALNIKLSSRDRTDSA